MEHDDTVSQRGFNEEKLESATAAGVSVKKLFPEVRCVLKLGAGVVTLYPLSGKHAKTLVTSKLDFVGVLRRCPVCSLLRTT